MKTTFRVERSPTAYGLTLALALGVAACKHKESARSLGASSAKPAIASSANALSHPVSSSGKPSLGAESDAAIAKKLTQCEPPAIDGSTRQLQGRLANWAKCVSELANNEVQTLNSSGGRSRLDAREVESMVESVCQLTEEAQNFDFQEDRPRLIGSLVGFAHLGCSVEANSSLYRMLKLSQSSPGMLKSHLEERRQPGIQALALLEKRFAFVKKHADKTPPPFAVSDCRPTDCPPYVTHKELTELYRQALRETQEIAAALCKALPELVAAIPDGNCVELIRAYFAANYEES